MTAEADLLAQFIPEARDLLEQAGRSLLALEREPGGIEPMNALFRAVHTLKGTSGLFAVEPLTRLVHAGEDVLCTVQAGRLPLDSGLADALLESLDLVSLWIDALAGTGTLPAEAQAASTQAAGRLRARLDAAVPQSADPAAARKAAGSGELPDWLPERPWSAQPAADRGPLLAIRYRPDEHCFFRGEDPLGLMRQLPGLRLLRAIAVDPLPPLADIDPFVCALELRAVAEASPDEAATLFQYVKDQVEIVLLPEAAPSESAPADALTMLLEAQHRLLTARGDEAQLAGRLAAAGRALRGIIAYAHRPDLAASLDAALDLSLASRLAAPLVGFIELVSEARSLPSTQPDVEPFDVVASVSEVRGPAIPITAAGPAILRVEQGKVDLLMNLIGELVVAKNSLAYLGRCAEQGVLTARELSREIKERHALVNRIADDMQAAIMSVRMLPAEHIFQRFPRLVRDLSRRLGKQVELLIEGGETEADKNIIEALADPLIHMVRNSLDHGIEMPAQRVEHGKTAHGTLRLSATQDNENVFIRVADDGRGIDPAVIRQKAVEKGLIERERAQALSDEDAVTLVFAPGFSTADAVSDLSGRGVGMDVVREAVEKVGGRVSISSRVGLGTTVELVLPLSMAVTRIMTVCCGQRLFGVPMSLVVETVRIPRTQLRSFRDREAFVLRDSVVPVIRLARLLDLPDEQAPAEEEAILVVRVGGERIGLVVGAFREGMEAIVKPMDGVLANLRGFAGTTLLGDGRVLLVLDLKELVT